jgi:hypothetical protein
MSHRAVHEPGGERGYKSYVPGPHGACLKWWSGFIVGSNTTPQTLNMHAHDLYYSHGGIFAILGGVVESLLTGTRHLC